MLLERTTKRGRVTVDTETGVLTRWDDKGVQIEQREMTEQEASRVDTWQDQNRVAVRDLLTDHIADLDKIIATSGTLTGAQLSNAVRVLAKGQKRLIKLETGDLASTE